MSRFRFSVPGQPYSVNHYLKPVVIRTKTGIVRRMGKVDGVEEYQLIASAMARRAMPVDFAPTGYLRIHYWWHMKRDLDTTNARKCLEDGVAAGIGINDKRFLSVDEGKEIGVKEPYTEIEVEWE
jgi:hypothetical protein